MATRVISKLFAQKILLPRDLPLFLYYQRVTSQDVAALTHRTSRKRSDNRLQRIDSGMAQQSDGSKSFCVPRRNSSCSHPYVIEFLWM
jgi:hypothetical protein